MSIYVFLIGIALNVLILPFAILRIRFLYRVISSGQPAPERIQGVTGRVGTAIKNQLVEVLGQKRLLKWTIPGISHAFVMWAFFILATVYLEAYIILLKRDPTGHIPFIGKWPVLGFAQDFIGMMCFFGIIAFAIIRLREDPSRLGRGSRFSGSHLGGAWLTLFMIFHVLWTLFLFRGAASAAGNFPYKNGAFISIGLGKLMNRWNFSDRTLEILEGAGLILHIGVMLVFLIFVLHSKHLHIFVAPLNVAFKRPDAPVALGAVKPMMANGKPLDLDAFEEIDEDTPLGVGKAEDFSWKAMLDFASCTECGRCQSQCPAWNTEKPLSPKLLIMGLRDHAFHKAPYLLESNEAKRAKMGADVLTEVDRELIGETEGDPAMPSGGAVIDPDVLWSCTNCGACVEQCPVDIEHIDHITDMRRYEVLVESNFPTELNALFRGLESNGNPWNLSSNARMEWAKDLPFDIKVVGEDITDLDEVEWLFWVGCAGAYEDRAIRTTQAVAELFDMAGVSFAVLGNGETCTGDPARRSGNEFVYQGLAAQNVETLTATKAKNVVTTCPHCMNTIKNEYKELGLDLKVIHHTQLLNRLVRAKKLVPVGPSEPAPNAMPITYHDPCFLGRHNKVYEPPRELITALPGAELREMERNRERSFCCGAGGARMWMEENIGERINTNRTKEAVATGAQEIATACPFCRVMIHDGLVEEQANGAASPEMQVRDVAQMLLASVKGEAPAARAAKPAPSLTGDAVPTPPTASTTATEPSAPAAGGSLFDDVVGSPAQASAPDAGSSLFDTPAPAEEKPAAGGSLFDTPAPQAPASDKPSDGGSLFDTPAPEAPQPAAPAEPAAEKPAAAGGSLFDVEAPAAPAAPEPPTADQSETDLGAGGSLFDVPASPAPAAAEASKPDASDAEEEESEAAKPADPAGQSEPPAAPKGDIPEGGSLFDI